MYHYIDRLEYRELVNSAFYKPKITDGRLLSTDKQQENRNKLIKYFQQNLPVDKIAKITGFSTSRVYALKKKYKEGNYKLEIEKRGRPPGNKIITDKLDNEIISNIIEEGIKLKKIWDKQSLQTMIKERFNTKLSISTIDKYLKERYIRFEDKIPSQNQTITIKQWILNRSPNIEDEIKEYNAIVCWTDAYCRRKIYNNVHLTRLIIYPHSKFMFSLSNNSNRVDSFIEYLTLLTKYFNKMVLLIADSLDILPQTIHTTLYKI